MIRKTYETRLRKGCLVFISGEVLPLLEVIPLEKAVDDQTYMMVKGLLGEETAFLLCYEPPDPEERYARLDP